MTRPLAMVCFGAWVLGTFALGVEIATGQPAARQTAQAQSASAQIAPAQTPSAQTPSAQTVSDAFVDPVAGILFEAAQTNWASVDESVVRYTALIQQRIAAAIRTPLKDRIIYRNETAVRAFWDQDHDAVVQVLGTHSQYPGRSIAVREGDLDWLDDLPFDEPFEPGGERLLLGLGDQDEWEDNDLWIAHPLAHGADSLYRYESGDTLTLSLPDGRRLQTIQLDVLPREADSRRITGTLWIEPESGALVRAVYRLSRQFDAVRDVAELQEEGFFKLEDLLLGGENLCFVLFEFRGNITFGSHQRLFADVVRRDGIQVSFGDLNEIAEHLVVFDFEGRNSRFLALLGFQAGNERLS